MKKTIRCILVLFPMMWLITACGRENVERIPVSTRVSMTSEEKEQQFLQMVKDEIKDGFLDQFVGINDIDVDVTINSNIWNIDLKIDYSDTLSESDIEDINHSIEKSLIKFCPVELNLSISTP